MDRTARIVEHVGMVRTLATRYSVAGYVQGLSVDDLVGYGVLGLIYAVDRFDEAQGKFSTYAFPCIRGHILSGIRGQARRYGRARQYVNARLLSGDAEAADGSTLFDRCASYDPREDITDAALGKSIAVRALAALDPRRREILVARYLREETPDEIADRMGLSKSRVEELQRSACLKAREAITGAAEPRRGLTRAQRYRARHRERYLTAARLRKRTCRAKQKGGQ